MSGSFRFPHLRMFAVSLFILITTMAGAFSASTASVPARGSSPAVAAAYEEGAGEYVTVYAKDCRTPQIVFNLGDTVCVRAGGFPLPLDNFNYRRLSWVAPNLAVANQVLFYSDPQTEYFEIPASGDLAQPGTWHAATINVHSGRRVNGKFYVRNPRLRFIDLALAMSAPERVYPGQKVRYNLSFHNPGPDFAEAVQIIDEVPTNMTFYALKQVSGPLFECTTPAIGETGRIVCTTKGLQVDETAQFAVYYLVNRDVREGTVFTSQTQISSYTEELSKENNIVKTETIFPLPDAEGGDIDP
jgi:uncharacterized repeat protein (TIGR01451 family)